jgi:hypothetical protein
MTRRTILATAAAITLVLATGAAAVAANVGLLGSATDFGDVGTLTPAAATSEPQTVIVEPAPADTPDSAAAPAVAPAPTGDHADDDRVGDEDRDESREGTDDSREHYEGSDDDD